MSSNIRNLKCSKSYVEKIHLIFFSSLLKMNPIIYNLKNKLPWMSSQLRQINRAWEIQTWISAMKDIHSLLEETAKNKELCQIPNTSKHLSLSEKKTLIRSTERSINRENSLKVVANLQPVHFWVAKEVSLEIDHLQAAHPLVDKDVSPDNTKNAVQRFKRLMKESSSKSSQTQQSHRRQKKPRNRTMVYILKS